MNLAPDPQPVAGPRYAQVVVDRSGPLGHRLLDYSIPAGWPEQIVGCRVRAPLGRRQAWGWIVGVRAQPEVPVTQVRPLARLLDPEPVLTKVQLQLAQRLAEETFATLAMTLRLVSPPGGWPGQRQALPASGAASNLGLPARDVPAPDGRQPPAPDLAALPDLLHVRSDDLLIRPNPQPPVAPADAPAVWRRAPARRKVWEHLLRSPQRWVSVAEAMQAAGVSRAVVLSLVRQGWVQAARRPRRGSPYREPEEEEEEKEEEEAEAIARNSSPHALTQAQAEGLRPILAAVRATAAASHGDGVTVASGPREFLLHGVTGSGKTEVYLNAISAVLATGRSAIVLVPEIALTPQTIRRFERRFGIDQVAVLHYRLGLHRRREEWERIRQGRARVVIGARSAIFAPTPRLGLVVIDEEHEPSYKQEEAPRYHARDVARLRSRLEGAVLLLGSATPALESYFAARRGSSRLLILPERIQERPLPRIQLVDLRREPAVRLGHPLGQLLTEQMREQVAAGHQVILFLNRRGLASFVLCRDCGRVVECPACQVSLTYHGRPPLLVCHYCGREQPVPTRCPSCGSSSLRPWGIGTEQVERAAQALAPQARVARLDSDSTRRQGAYEQILGAFARHEIQVLVGTQMVAKGLDFPDVTLVGVVGADTGLGLPDFRAAERTFQLLIQVAGRAGRSAAGGQVIVQTYNPEHYAIRRASQYDYLGFYREELALRRVLRYPPYTALARVLIQGPTDQSTRQQAEAAASTLAELGAVRGGHLGPAGLAEGQVEIIGPAPAPLARLQGQYRWHLLLKAWERSDLLGLLQQARARWPDQVDHWTVDIGPLSVM